MLELDKIYNMDCIDGLKQLDNNCIDIVITDPPYFAPAQHYSPSRKNRTQRKVGDLSILEYFFHNWIKEIIRVMKNTGWIYIFCDSQSYPLVFTGLYSHVKSVRLIVWDKVTAFNGFTWRHQHELIVFAEMPDAPKVNTSDGDIIRERVTKVEDRQHPAEKPESIITKILSKHTSAGVVLDPFVGCGTTAVVCKHLNKHFIGFEIDEDYCKLAENRVYSAELPLEGFQA